MRLFILCIFIVACHTGNFREECNKDGSCNNANLVCLNGWCETKPPSKEPGRCYYESECFCVTCADKCGDAGVKTCAYSDTSVWESKPAVCECK